MMMKLSDSFFCVCVCVFFSSSLSLPFFPSACVNDSLSVLFCVHLHRNSHDRCNYSRFTDLAVYAFVSLSSSSLASLENFIEQSIDEENWGISFRFNLFECRRKSLK